jgi:hypothetical protein
MVQSRVIALASVPEAAVANERLAAAAGPPWADAPEVTAPGGQVPAPEAVPEARAGRHRRARRAPRARRKAGGSGGRHHSR